MADLGETVGIKHAAAAERRRVTGDRRIDDRGRLRSGEVGVAVDAAPL